MADHDVALVQAVLLDLGGVLIHVHFQLAVAHWADAAGIPVDAVAARFAQDEAYAQHERGDFSFADYAVHLRRRLQLDLDDDALLTGWNRALGSAMPGALALVATLRHRFPLFLFSNSNAAHCARWSRDQAELLRHFARVFVSHELGLRKPDPDAFRRVVSHLGVDPGSVAFFDDLEENVTGARQAGLMAFTVRGPGDVGRILRVAPPV